MRFEDFLYAVLQWYLECDSYSSCAEIHYQEAISENIAEEQKLLRADTKTSERRVRRSILKSFAVWKPARVFYLISHNLEVVNKSNYQTIPRL
jgi:hypothetical protein